MRGTTFPEIAVGCSMSGLINLTGLVSFWEPHAVPDMVQFDEPKLVQA